MEETKQPAVDIDSIALDAATKIFDLPDPESLKGPTPGQHKARIQCIVREALENYRPTLPPQQLDNIKAWHERAHKGATIYEVYEYVKAENIDLRRATDTVPRAELDALRTELVNVKAALATAEKMLEEQQGIPATFEIDELSFLKVPEGAKPGEEFPMEFPTFTASRDEVIEAGARALYERSGDPADSILYRAHQLILDAKSAGQVLTIELKPLKPLAMGSYFMAADLRPARAKASDQ